MYVLIDDRRPLVDNLKEEFRREGLCLEFIEADDFADWFTALSDPDAKVIEAFLIGRCAQRLQLPNLVRRRCDAPILCFDETLCFHEIVSLLNAGADDVVAKWANPLEVVARVCAINRRARKNFDSQTNIGALRIFGDGRPPEVEGEIFELSRREQRILEYLARNRRRFVTKAQIFNAVYGLFDHETDERVIESHICKLRKKLRLRLGVDPITTRRYLGYMLAGDEAAGASRPSALSALPVRHYDAPAREFRIA